MEGTGGMSGMNFTEAQFEELQKNLRASRLDPLGPLAERGPNPPDISGLTPRPLSSGSRKEKYGRVKKEVDGIVFDSTSEAEAYKVLKLWESIHAISGLKLQPVFVLQEKFTEASTDGPRKSHRAIKYIADFQFSWPSSNRFVSSVTVVDVKGVLTPAFRIKEKLFRQKFPDLDLQIWNRDRVRELSRG